MNISVITAMYNEEDSVPSLVANYRKVLNLAPQGWNFEFLFVDDGSKDNSIKVLMELSPRELNFKVLRHETNKGFGAALRTGIAAAKGDIIVCYDADSTYPVEDIVTLVNKVIEGWDVASANPFHQAKIIEKVPLWRQALTFLNAGLYRLSLGKAGKNITVFSCAFRAYSRNSIQSINFNSNGFGAASEILGRLILGKYKVIEVPSSLSTRQFGQSKMNLRKAIGEHLKNVSMFLKIKYLKY